METENNSWNAITASLESLRDETLTDLISESQLRYDGNYIINAQASTYSQLCSYFPLIETVVQDQTGKHFRLNLDPGVPMGTDFEQIRLSPGASNLTDAILNPEAIVAVPSYLLRFVPFVGSSPVLIATVLRQAFYFASRQTGASQLYPNAGNEVTIDVHSILKMLGNSISRAKFFRIFKSGGMDWFVTRSEAAHQIVDGQIRRLPNTYTYQGQVLCPGDAADLAAWLERNDFHKDPATVLRLALESPRNQILVFPYRLPEKGQQAGPALSVRQVVSQVLGISRLDPTLSGLCDRLSGHLIRPESFLAVPWYWFRNVLPELGDDLGMLYLMAKNCCYIDWARGQDRNQFWVLGGLESLQAWIGSETLPKRIPHKAKSKRGRPRSDAVLPDSQYTRDWRLANRELASQYLVRTATRKNEFGIDWQLHVHDVQLTARDETLRHAIAAFLHSLPEEMNEETLRIFAQSSAFQSLMLEQTKTHPTRLCHFETLVNQGICQNETLNEEAISHFDTLVNGLNCYFETLIEAEICQFDTVIKILIKIKNSFQNDEDNQQPQTHTNSDSKISIDSVAGLNKDLDWDYAWLLKEVNPSLRDRVLSHHLEEVYLSWLIQVSLSPTVHSPISLAISRCFETHLPASAASQRLAELNPSTLKDLLGNVISRLEKGQTGRFASLADGAADLALLLQGVEDLSTQKRLLTRLRDHIA